MIKSLAIISLLTSVAFAQSGSSSAAAATATGNPLIPTGISSGCSDFLTSLNNDTSLTTCTSSLISATSAFGPGGSASSSPSAATVSSTLTNLCSTSTCSESVISGKLAGFYSACAAELTSNPNVNVTKTYDVLYAITPLLAAVCSKDTSGSWCVMNATAPAAASSLAGSSRRRAVTSAVVPDFTTYSDTNLPFLFLTSSSSNLCSDCTRSIVTAYTNFESKVPYASGLGSSPLLNTQPALYSGIVSTCGSTFLTSTTTGAQNVGGLGNSLTSGASAVRAEHLIMLVLGAVTLAFSSAL